MDDGHHPRGCPRYPDQAVCALSWSGIRLSRPARPGGPRAVPHGNPHSPSYHMGEKIDIKITDLRRRAEVASDLRVLVVPQPFRLHGDGGHTAMVSAKKRGANLAGELA